MSTTYLKSCYDELKLKNNARQELGHLTKYMQEKVDTSNKNEFIDYLNKLILKKKKEVKLEWKGDKNIRLLSIILNKLTNKSIF